MNLPGSSLRLAHICLAAAAVVSIQQRSPAAGLPAGFTETLVAGGLDSATAMTLAPDGRIFICEQGGALRIVRNGVLLPKPFVTMNTQALGERGLLGVTTHPAYATNGWVYVYHTMLTPNIHNRVTRFTANGDHPVVNSKTVIFDLDDLSAATNHNGGAIHFGRGDGKLYVAAGENGISANAQSLTNVLGKILRLNDDGSIPFDNPFYNQASGRNRAIWVLGLRNPFTFSFQPVTGRMFINDVGEGTWEEINEGIPGANYGWPVTEGPTTDPRFRGPLFAYRHGGGSTTGCAITGGAFYNPHAAEFPPDYVGKYFFADLCSGWIRRYDPATGDVQAFATGIGSGVVDLKVGGRGYLYYLTRTQLWRVGYSGS
ncbi:MAG: PQQ-dependent sugar dehydrogenase [Bryobacterales bacterium]|nr:PQQ-dependent sugar dehydrogenase [Bryobacterales bacterium]